MKKIIIFTAIILFYSTSVFAYDRIVSLSPAVTEEIYLLGAQDKLAGTTIYCVNPEAAREKEKIGTVTDINIEKILSLRPDVVIATPLTNKTQLEKLETMGVKVHSFPLAKDFYELCGQFRKIAEFAGKKNEAEEIVANAEKKVEAVNLRVKGLPKVKVFMQVGSNPLYTMTKDSFVNNYIELAGGINIAAENISGLYSREEVLKQDPDAIMIISMGITAEKEKKAWERYGNMKAVRNKKVCILDSYKICSPTPSGFSDMLEEIAKILHE